MKMETISPLRKVRKIRKTFRDTSSLKLRRKKMETLSTFYKKNSNITTM